MNTLSKIIDNLLGQIQSREKQIIHISNSHWYNPKNDCKNLISVLESEKELLYKIVNDLKAIPEDNQINSELIQKIVEAIKIESCSQTCVERLSAKQDKIIADSIRAMFNSQNHFKDINSFIKSLEGWNRFCNGMANMFKRRYS